MRPINDWRKRRLRGHYAAIRKLEQKIDGFEPLDLREAFAAQTLAVLDRAQKRMGVPRGARRQNRRAIVKGASGDSAGIKKASS